MEIREAKIEEVDQIVPIMLEIANLHSEERPDIFKKKEEKELEKEIIETLSNQEFKVLVSCNGKNKIEGVVVCKIKDIKNHKNLKDAKILWIDEICVTKESRKKGIGKALMQKAKEIAKEEKCERVELNCWSFNENAIKFYKKIGMQEQRINLEFEIKGGKENEVF